MKGLALVALFLLFTSYTGSQSMPVPDVDSFDGLNQEVITLNEKLKQYGKGENISAGDAAGNTGLLLVDKEIDQAIEPGRD